MLLFLSVTSRIALIFPPVFFSADFQQSNFKNWILYRRQFIREFIIGDTHWKFDVIRRRYDLYFKTWLYEVGLCVVVDCSLRSSVQYLAFLHRFVNQPPLVYKWKLQK